MKKWKTQVKGITLIALVVTIIVLLILAGIAISLTIGNNGLFSRAGNAANTWRKAEANEAEEMRNFEDLYDNTVKDLGLDGERKEITFSIKDEASGTTYELKAYEGDTWYTWLNDVKNGLYPSEFANNYYDLVEGWILWADNGWTVNVFCKLGGMASGAEIYYKGNNGERTNCLNNDKIIKDIEYLLYAE